MKFFKLLIIPLILLFGFFVLFAYPYFFSKINSYYSLGISSLVEEKSEPFDLKTSSKRTTDKLDNHLLKGEKIVSKFKATEDNLGVVLFRFSQINLNVTDFVTFRIKEEASKKWYYMNKYKVDQFMHDQYFTFGFPQIQNSKGKVYVIEIESLAGTVKNSVGWSKIHPQAAMVYNFDKEQLKDPRVLTSFIVKKFIYAFTNLRIWQHLQVVTTAIVTYLVILLITQNKLASVGILPHVAWKRFAKNIKSKVFSLEKPIVKSSNNIAHGVVKTKFYSFFLNTSMKKRLTISVILFLIAVLDRFSSTAVDQLGVSSFYASLGGQGDYDQFIRAATCALQLCPAILGQNFVIESSVLGAFYNIFGFTGGLKAYLYLMIILSSIVATLPYIILSRNNVFTIGGIIGSLFLATSDYFIRMALSLPPDNGSLFTFSMFYIVYLLTMYYGTIWWLVFFGVMGTIDGLNKFVILMNDVTVLLLFIPVFLYDKAKKLKKFPFVSVTSKLVLYALVPFLVFLVLYSLWEIIVEIKFGVPYYLRGMIENGSTYLSRDDVASDSINIFSKSIWEILYYYAGSTIVLQKRIIDYGGLNSYLLAPVFIGLLFFTFRNVKSSADGLMSKKIYIAKLLAVVLFLVFVFILLVSFKNNFLGIHEVDMYVTAWPISHYINIFLFTTIIFLFFLNFKYTALRLIIPILPYYIILIIIAKNAPWGRMQAHVIVWSVILLCFLLDWILRNTKKDKVLKRLWIGPFLLAIFLFFYFVPKQVDMVEKLYASVEKNKNEVTYLRWVNSELPENAIILGGGKSDLATVGQYINKSIIYNTSWSAAVMIKPNEVPGVNPDDFSTVKDLKITNFPGAALNNFNILEELKNKENFEKNKYFILESDKYLWQERLAGVKDNVFSSESAKLVNPNNYAIKVYKFNFDLNKGIYELKHKEVNYK